MLPWLLVSLWLPIDHHAEHFKQMGIGYGINERIHQSLRRTKERQAEMDKEIKELEARLGKSRRRS